MSSLDDRVLGIEEIVRRLTKEQYISIGRVVGADDDPEAWPPSERYWFSGNAGARLDNSETRAARRLWTRLQVAVSAAVTGIDVEGRPSWHRASWLPSALREYLLRNDLEGGAATVLERALGAEAWRPMIGVWNACCSALFAERLTPELKSSLERAWATAIGSTPRERLRIE